MKTINLQQFHAQVIKLAAKKKRPYCTVSVDLGQHVYTDGQTKNTITFKCYVDGYNHYEGKTPAEALAKLKAVMFPSTKPIPTVEVDL